MKNQLIPTFLGAFAYFAGYSQQNVGIGTNTPTYPLTVIAPGNGKGIVQKTQDVEIGFYTSNNVAFLQTWSNHAINFSTNNGSSHMIINTLGQVGIGTSTPTAILDVNGQMRVRGGTPGVGKVLTSDAAGLATWQTPSIRASNFFSSNSVTMLNGTGSIVPFLANVGGSFADMAGFDNLNNQFVVSAATAGTYLISAQVTWDISASYAGAKDFILELRNGDNTIAINRMVSDYISTFIGSTQRSQQISFTTKLVEGNQIKLWAMQRTGVSQSIIPGSTLTWLSLVRLY